MPTRGTIGRKLTRLIEQTYDSAFESRPFASLLPELTAMLGADTAHVNMWVPKLGGELAVSHEMPEHLIRLYRDHHWRTDLWRHALERQKIPVGRAFAGHKIVPYEELLKSEMYNEALRPYGLFDICGGRILELAQAGAAVSFMRARGRPFFTRSEVARLGAVLPHMARAFSIRLRLDNLAGQRDSFATLLDSLVGGAFILDCKGRVSHATVAALAFVGARASPLRIERGHLRARDPAVDRQLQKLFAGGGTASCLQNRSAIALDATHWLRVIPSLFAGGLLPRVAEIFIVIENDLTAGCDGVASLTNQCRLTAAESSLLRELVTGASLAEAASRLGRARTTTRNQLQSIFAKTGTHRQAELIAMVLKQEGAARP